MSRKTTNEEEVSCLFHVRKSKYPQLYHILQHTKAMSRAMTAIQLCNAGVMYLKEHPDTAKLLFPDTADALFQEPAGSGSPARPAPSPAVISAEEAPAKKPAPAPEKKPEPAAEPARKEPPAEVPESRKTEEKPEKKAPKNSEEKSGDSDENPDNSKGGIADLMGGEGFSI